jgi:hypothetical protein
MNKPSLNRNVKVSYIRPKVIKTQSEFSLRTLLLFGVAFLAIGSWWLYNSFALDSGSGSTTTPAGDTSTIKPVLDTYVNSATPTTSYEAATTLKGTNVDRKSFICLDASDVPKAAAIQSVSLKLYPTVNATTTSGIRIFNNNAYGCRAAGQPLTWNNSTAQRAIFSATPLATSAAPKAGVPISVTLPNSVITASRQISLGIDYSVSGSQFEFSSKEGSVSPQLIVNWQESNVSTALSLSDLSLTDVSGLAQSQRTRGLRWVMQDRSHQAPDVWAINEDGATRSKVTMTGTTISNIDPEDIATAVIGGTPYVYVYDGGGNANVRTSIKVHRFMEPTGATLSAHPLLSLAASTWTYTYPSGDVNAARTAGPDSECLLVDPSTGRMYFIVKNGTGLSDTTQFGIYAAPMAANSAPGTYALTKIATTRMSASGSTWSQDRSRIALYDYTHVYIYTVSNGDVAAALASTPAQILGNGAANTTNPIYQPQGEGVSFSQDGRAVELSSEIHDGTHAKVLRAPVTRTVRVTPLSLIP